MNQRSVVIIGAGIAGLGASYALRKSGVPSVILEKDCDYGGLCKASALTVLSIFPIHRMRM